MNRTKKYDENTNPILNIHLQISRKIRCSTMLSGIRIRDGIITKS